MADIASEHFLVGRIAAHGDGMATFCRCGAAFFGKDTDDADKRWYTHATRPPITFDQALTVDLAPGTIIVLSTTREITAEQLDDLDRQWAARFPDNPLMVLDGLVLDSVIAARQMP